MEEEAMRLVRLVLAVTGGLLLAACDSEQTPTATTRTPLQADVQASTASVGINTVVTAAGALADPIPIVSTIFVRGTSSPKTETITFAATSGAQYIVDIDDLGSRGADGSVVLNGDTLLAPRTGADIGARHVTTTIGLNALNTLVVRLLGKPGSVLQVRITPFKPVTLDAVTFTSPTTIQIGGPGATFNSTITNHTAGALTDIAVQAWVVQGVARRAASGSLVFCNAAFGVLPPGTCTRVGDGVIANNASAGTGTLVAGSATAVIQVVQVLAGGNVVFDSVSFPIALTGPPAGDFWSTVAPLPTPRRLLAAAEEGGRVYTFGGCGSDCSTILEQTRVETYDPATDTWVVKAPMPVSFFLGAAAAPGNGRIYTLGGVTSEAVVQEYDPATDSWAPKAPMPTGRYGLVAVTVNGRIYAIGGNGPSNAVEAYDPATDTWTAKAPMPTPRLLFAAAVLDGKIYAMGGSPDAIGNGQTSAVEVYDPVTNTWTTRAPLPAAMQVSAGAAVAGKVYVFGGFVDCCAVGNATFAYDPVMNVWASKAPMPSARDEAPGVVVNGTVYVMGGADAGRNALSANQKYTP